MLDVAGQKELRRGQWKQCASMLARRMGFGCGALDGKIYVFGGTLDGGTVEEENSGF